MRISTDQIFAQITQEASVEGDIDPSGSLDDPNIILKSDTLLAIKYANIIIFVAASFSLIWAFISYKLVSRVDMKADLIQVNQMNEEEIEDAKDKNVEAP